MNMTNERLKHRHAMWIRLKELNWMQSRNHLMHGAGCDLVANEIHQLETELRRKEGQA